MQTRSNRRIALLVALALPLSGCSWIFMTKAPEPVAAPNYPVDCTASSAAPILDTICAAYFVANGIYWLAADCNGVNCDSGMQAAGVALSAGLAVLCGVSAGAGYPAATRCQQVKDLNALCITGNMEACQRLRPGWTPPAAPYPGVTPYPGAAPYPGVQPAPPPPAPQPAPPAAPPPAKPGAAAPWIDPAAYQAAVASAAR